MYVPVHVIKILTRLHTYMVHTAQMQLPYLPPTGSRMLCMNDFTHTHISFSREFARTHTCLMLEYSLACAYASV